MGFEEFGRALDNISEHLSESVSDTMEQLSRAIRAVSQPRPFREGRRLTEDLCREGYALVERNDVRVERVPAETSAGDAATVRYHDGSEWTDVTRYDCAAITARGAE